MSENKRWVVIVSGDHPVEEVEARLIDAGFTLDEVLSAIGCILGVASEEVAEKSRTIPGVTEVSPEPPPVSISPPDAPLS